MKKGDGLKVIKCVRKDKSSEWRIFYYQATKMFFKKVGVKNLRNLVYKNVKNIKTKKNLLMLHYHKDPEMLYLIYPYKKLLWRKKSVRRETK